MPLSRRTSYAATTLCLALVAACSDSPTEPGSGPPAAIIVEGASNVIAVGDTAALTARVVDAGGRVLATPAVAWSSLDTAVAFVVDDGRVVGHDAGVARIVARAGELADTTTFQVEVRPHHVDFVVSGWNYVDTSSTVFVGLTLQLRAVLEDARGRVLATSAQPTFTVDDASVATAPGAASGGWVTTSGLRTGRATYTARLAGVEGRITVKFGLSPIALQGRGLSQVAIGALHGCGLDAGGAARCWGYNSRGQLGRTIDTDDFNSPLGAVVGTPAFASIAARGYGACAITAQRSLWCWGESNLPAASAVASPILDGVTSVALGAADPLDTRAQTCALMASGEVRCWGLRGASRVDSTPAIIDTPLRFTAIGVGRLGYGCGLQQSGRVACWTSSNAPMEVGGTYDAFTRVGVGDSDGCGLSGTGQAWCWTGVSAAAPVQTAERFVDLAKGRTFACGITSAGAIWCWGLGPAGNIARAVPVNIGGDERFRALLASDVAACGVREDGDLRCENFYMTVAQP